MCATHSPENVNHDNSAAEPRNFGRRVLVAAVTAGAFVGLSGVVAPMASAQEEVKGKIAEEYVAAAEANGQTPEEFFGAATSPELDAANGGKFQTFEKEKRSIYWNPDVAGGQANQVGGDIFDLWGETTMNGSPGYEWGPLNYPTTREWSTNESGASGVTGRGNHFEGGSIYWSEEHGAQLVWGLVRDAWWQVGAESSELGLPIAAETFDGSGWMQKFEGGVVVVRTDGLARVSVNGEPSKTEPVPINELTIGG